MKTLIVKYLPSGERSNTKKLLDLYIKELGNRPYEVVDLLKEPLPFFTEESMAAYGKRNYGGMALNEQEQRSLAEQDRLVKQLKSADVVVMAYPMHNFGMPGVVKTYFDAVMLNGETFKMGEKMMAGKKALTLYTAGGLYTPDIANLQYPNWDTLSLNAKINFTFMGFDEAEVIATSLRDPHLADGRLIEADQKIRALISKWYR
jgi:FMN-dependent NADH-azoreductase